MRIGLTENIRMREITRNANARGSTAQCVKEVMEGGALSNSQYLPVSSVFLHGMGSNNPCSKRATPTNSLKCI